MQSSTPSVNTADAVVVPDDQLSYPPSDHTAITHRKLNKLKLRMFVLTFLSYAIYSGTRQPFGITKAALSPDHEKDPDAPGYAPFNDESWGSTYLGACDTVFLSAYAVGLFITGPLGDRLNLRWFMGIGMLGSGLFCFLFGCAALFNIHNLAWFIFCNIFAGLFQATGWPSNVTLMTRWFGQGNRGTIMGIWNAQSSVGNIIGKFWATFWLHQYGWGYAFLGSGSLCMVVGLIELMFVLPHPHSVLTPSEMSELEKLNRKGRIASAAVLSKDEDKNEGGRTERSSSASMTHRQALMEALHQPTSSPEAIASVTPVPTSASNTVVVVPTQHRHHDDYESISFTYALTVPGVLEYSFCLFFSKLVAYAFTFWLPFYLTNINYSDNAAGNLSTVFDIGGVAGGIIAGWWSDYSGKRGVVSVTMLLLCLPGLWMYSFLAQYGLALNIILMFIAGILVNGPYTLILGVVAADLGNHFSLKGNPKAMSTVTGIVDGAGSVGAALQGVVVGIAGKKLGWSYVFYMLEGFCLFAAICLFRIVKKELGPMDTWRCFCSKAVPEADPKAPLSPRHVAVAVPTS